MSALESKRMFKNMRTIDGIKDTHKIIVRGNVRSGKDKNIIWLIFKYFLNHPGYHVSLSLVTAPIAPYKRN